MRYLSFAEVDEGLADEAWKRVASTGSYYSIGDGVAKAVFFRVLFQSNFVLQAPNILLRLEVGKDLIEVHPIAFGPSIFSHARDILQDIGEIRDRLFAGKPICCIIPDGLRGAKRLAVAGGMVLTGKCERPLSGVMLKCSIFTWRQ